MKKPFVVLLCLLAISAAKAAPALRFTLPVGALDFEQCRATPGNVPIPLAATNLNLEIVDWSAAPVAKDQPGEFLIALKQAVAVGAIFVYNASEISYKAGGQWKTLAGADEGRALRVVPFPEGSVVEAIKITVPARRISGNDGKEAEFKATLPFASLLPVRVVNIGKRARVSASSTAKGDDPQELVDGMVRARKNFATAPRNETTSGESPEWVMFSWKKPQQIRGVAIFRGSDENAFGESVTEAYVGPGDPDEAEGANGWQAMDGRITLPGAFRNNQVFVTFNPIETKALRIRSVGAARQIEVGEVLVLQDLSAADDSEAVTEKKPFEFVPAAKPPEKP